MPPEGPGSHLRGDRQPVHGGRAGGGVSGQGQAAAEQQEAGGQWDSNGIGSGQEILVDDMLTVDEWLASKAEL